MKSQSFIARADNARSVWRRAFEFGAELMEYGAVEIVVKSVKATRSSEQNRKLWACLGDIAKQVQWPVNGELRWLDADDWKHVLSAGLKQHQRVAAGLDGGFVILGQRTSKMTVGQMSTLIELILAFGSQRGVQWSDPEIAAQDAALEAIRLLKQAA